MIASSGSIDPRSTAASHFAAPSGRDDGRDAGLVDRPLDLGFGCARVQRNERAARLPHAEPRRDRFGACSACSTPMARPRPGSCARQLRRRALAARPRVVATPSRYDDDIVGRRRRAASSGASDVDGVGVGALVGASPCRSPRTRPAARATGRRARPASASRIAAHTRSGVHGMSMCRTPRCASASTTALCTAGVEPIVPDSPMPFAPSGLRGDGVSVFDRFEARELGRARHRVVGERRRERVAVGVVDVLLPQRLRDALRDAAVLLARDDQRVEDAAAVVDRDVAERRHAVRCRDRPRRRRRARRTGTSRRPARSRDRVQRLAAARPRAHGSARAGTPATPRRPSSVTTMSSGLASSMRRRDLAGLREHGLGRVEHRGPAELQRTRAAGAAAGRHDGGVGLHERDCRRAGCCSRSATIIANDVAWPCPCADVPT